DWSPGWSPAWSGDRSPGEEGDRWSLPEDVRRDLARLRPPPRVRPGAFVVPVPIDPQGVAGPTADQARGPRGRRTSRNRYVPADAVVDQPVQRIVELVPRLPGGAGVTGWASLHLAGARWFGGTESDGAELPVALALGPMGKRRPIEGVRPWREVVLPADLVVRQGVPCTSAERAVFDEMRRTTSVRLAVQALEMAMYAELTSLSRFRAYLLTRNRRTGVQQARDATGLAVEGPESPQETLMHLVWECDAGLPRPLCNVDVYSVNGEFLGRPDLLDPVAGVVGEYDGGHHRLASVRRADVSREERFRAHGLEYFTVVEGDLPRRQLVVDRMLRTRERALRSREPRLWTLTPPPGVRPRLSLDRRLELREILAAPR
ncbi:MAG TPA: hypothetical protein PLP61_15415, partial [Nocardioides sp.]|uniref:hypothetical protein n=1 Tax=Nocardioides sp. TaxID=35761 RepID=UPI002CF36E53